MAPSERIGWKLYADAFRDDDGTRTQEAGVELAYDLNDRTRLELGAEHLDRTDPGAPDDETGRRTDLAARLTLTPRETLRLHVFGQLTADRAGGLRANNRAGVGADWAFAERWRLEAEISGGNLGPGGEVLLGYDNGADGTGYLGYRLEPERDFGAVELSGRDRGQLVAGGTRKLGDRIGLRAESTYDLFGDHRALVTGYGVDYEATPQLSFGLTSEMGRIEDARLGDVDRDAVSVEMRYEDGDWTQARARLELRRDRGVSSGVSQDLDAALFTADANWKIDETQRLSLALDYADIDGETGGLADGTYVEAGIGYAFRPVRSDRLNLLFQYRYLRDLVGQEIDGVEGSGPVQRTHILSVDGEYDLSPRWSLGAKIGGRWSESAPNADADFADNDAWLGVLNARWHVVGKWDALLETRYLKAEQGGFRRSGVLGALYRHVGDNAKIGLGYNFGSFSDDLADLTYADGGIFVNVIGKF